MEQRPEPIEEPAQARAKEAAPSPKTQDGPRDAPLSAQEVEQMHAYWRTCNYLAVAMIYLQENPLLRRPLEVDDVKQRLLGHRGGEHRAAPTRSP